MLAVSCLRTTSHWQVAPLDSSSASCPTSSGSSTAFASMDSMPNFGSWVGRNLLWLITTLLSLPFEHFGIFPPELLRRQNKYVYLSQSRKMSASDPAPFNFRTATFNLTFCMSTTPGSLPLPYPPTRSASQSPGVQDTRKYYGWAVTPAGQNRRIGFSHQHSKKTKWSEFLPRKIPPNHTCMPLEHCRGLVLPASVWPDSRRPNYFLHRTIDCWQVHLPQKRNVRNFCTDMPFHQKKNVKNHADTTTSVPIGKVW